MHRSYLIDEHRHRFAAWAAARASSRGVKGLTVERARKWLEMTGLKKLISNPANLPAPTSIDKKHATWRKRIIKIARKDSIELSDGRAAKLINIYLKSVFVCGGFHEDARVKALHPPIDRVLLNGMRQAKFGNASDWRGINWTELTSKQYQEVIDRIRSACNGIPMWKVEKYWLPVD